MKNNGGPAFPVQERRDDSGWYILQYASPGMTLRQWYAGQALAGQIQYEGMDGCDTEKVAGMAFELADAMIEEGNK